MTIGLDLDRDDKKMLDFNNLGFYIFLTKDNFNTFFLQR
jgi:hypothetical protein